MPEYEYKCDNCGVIGTVVDTIEPDKRVEWDEGKVFHVTESDRGPWQCGVMKRKFSFNMAPVMQEHFNATVGKPISDPRQFERELKRAGEAIEERTGIPHDYQPCDLTDMDALGVDDTGLKETHDAMVAAGTKPATGRTVFKMGE